MSRRLHSGEVAKILGVHPNSVTSWARDGKLHDIRVPGTGIAVFDEDEILALAGGTQPFGAGDYQDGFKAGLRELARMLRNMAADTDPDYEDVSVDVYTRIRTGYGFLLAAVHPDTQSDRDSLLDAATKDIQEALELLEKSRPVIAIAKEEES